MPPAHIAYWLRLVLMALAVAAIGLCSGYPFFWDTIQLGSKHAHWYYETGFRELLLPEKIDSGHPPAFGLYLALAWTIFGKSLAVSHWAMLPFVWGILWLLFPIGRYFAPRLGWLFPLLALANPMLLTQMLLISPDLVLVFGFLLGLYGVMYGRASAKAAGALVLAAISTRGMMVVVALFLFDSWRGLGLTAARLRFRYLWQTALPYVPSGLLALAFLAYHYQAAGWIGYHAASEWATTFERADGARMLRNGLILGWRFLDFGLVFVWVGMAIAAGRIWRKQRAVNAARLKEAGALLLLTTFLLSITFLVYQGLHQHRYLLPAMIALQLFAFTLIAGSTLQRLWKAGLLALLLLGPISGHFWVYPDSIAQGWDVTLAHLPYYGLKEDMIDYLDEAGIPLHQVGTAFPEIGPQYLKDLSGRQSGFVSKNLDEQEYILYSNVMNDFTDEELEQLQSEWTTIRQLESGGIKLILFGKP